MRSARRRQLELFIEAQELGNDGLEALYRRLYFIPKHERMILILLGMLTGRISIPTDLFCALEHASRDSLGHDFADA